LVPLWPAPMPSTARPFETWSSDAIAAALTAGCRVSRLVTQSATRVAARRRHHRGRHPWVQLRCRRVGNADHDVAVAVRALRQLFAEIERIGPEKETNFHVHSLGVEFRTAVASGA